MCLSRRFGTRLRLRRARTQNDNKVVYERPWHRSQATPPRQRVPIARKVTIEELRTQIGTEDEWHDQIYREAIARRERPRIALVRQRRRGHLRLGGKRLRIDDPVGRMNAWKSEASDAYGAFGDYREGDWRKVRFTEIQIAKVLKANALSIQHLQEDRDLLQPKYQSLSDSEVARLLAYGEIGLLTCRLCELRIHPPFPRQVTQRKLDDHKRQLSSAAEALKRMLFDELTDLTWAPRPASRLAHLRQELSDFCSEVHPPILAGRRNAQQHLGEWFGALKSEDTHNDVRQSALEHFIDENLRAAFEYVYACPCAISRGADGTPYGPFITFAQAFFAEAGFKTPAGTAFPSAETIARALRPNRRVLDGGHSGARRRSGRVSPN